MVYGKIMSACKKENTHEWTECMNKFNFHRYNIFAKIILIIILIVKSS